MSDDKELVRAARRGESKAFGALVRKYQNSLYAFVRSRVSDPAAAEDVAQEVFLAAYRQLDALSDEARFAGWLFGIARRKVLLFYRQRGRGIQAEAADFNRVAAPEIPDSAEGLAEALFSGLPDEQRAALLLRFQEGLSYRAIAERLGVPLGTVGTLLHRARNLASLNYQKWNGARL